MTCNFQSHLKWNFLEQTVKLKRQVLCKIYFSNRPNVIILGYYQFFKDAFVIQCTMLYQPGLAAPIVEHTKEDIYELELLYLLKELPFFPLCCFKLMHRCIASTCGGLLSFSSYQILPYIYIAYCYILSTVHKPTSII